ncbi:MAG: double-strand break repair protein AddB [Candidatus Marinimicrobia bacterium]|nr:double-strand break repair protein AddB [Candidatus Neomarinimicrobiota bacterium]
MTKSKTWRELAKAKPAIFTIAPHMPFLDTLAHGVYEDAGHDPLKLSAITIILPTRRACRSLRESFLRLSKGKPLLLPRLMPLNDLDEEEMLLSSFRFAESIKNIPPPIAPLRRQLLLARLIQARGDPSTEHALRLAEELGKLLDQVQTEQLSLDNLADLVPEDYAVHWQITLKFLGILMDSWPKILKAENTIDAADHRNQVFSAQSQIWAAGAANGPVIAAGSTGSIPVTAKLLDVIANMDKGAVVLPGLDQSLNQNDWKAIDESHPQYGFKQLLQRFKVYPHDVLEWPGKPKYTNRRSRARFLTEVMRPASTTHAWQSIDGVKLSSIKGIARINCPAPREEAEVISLIMREALTVGDRTCALVTPDRTLAERVSMELNRWNIDIDDSAGRPLHKTPPGAFLRLVAVMVAENFAPVPTLAACKHPLAAGGLDIVKFRNLTRLAEIKILRGPRPPAGLTELSIKAKELEGDTHNIESWIKHLKKCCEKFTTLMAQDSVAILDLLNAHMSAAEALATTKNTAGPLRLWAESEGEEASKFIAELAQHCDVLLDIPPLDYPAVFDVLMSSRVVRPSFGKHPRLHILGPLEARLQRFDVLILAGLNEGTWPNEAEAGPWMSRPMRRKFGLPSPERRIGLAAHDITQALCGPRVVLTRSVKVNGTPTVPSRWLMRLERAVEAAGLSKAFKKEAGDWLSWASKLTQPDSYQSISPPAPRPPIKVRPRRLSVTEVETWMRDPYSIYAKHILKLRRIDPLDQEVNAADYGSLVHDALRRFIAAHPCGLLPDDALSRLMRIGDDVFKHKSLPPSVLAFWAPRFERIAAWFVRTEDLRRQKLDYSFVEIMGEITLQGPAGAFILTGKADRIDRSTDDRISIIDYKTGTPPGSAEVVAGFSPQLPLEAAIMVAGGFARISWSGAFETLSFLQLHGRDEGGKEFIINGDANTLAAEARTGLAELVKQFDDPSTAYEARPNPTYAPIFSDYGHLARVKEWATGEDE